MRTVIRLEEIDRNLVTAWRIKWKGVDQHLTFEANSLGVANAIANMHRAFHEAPDEVWIALPGNDKLTRVL